MGEVVPFGPRPERGSRRVAHRPWTDAGQPVRPRAVETRDAGPEALGPGGAGPRRPAEPARPSKREPLWRDVAGSVLADERRRQQRTLAQVAARAGMSVQYLSELERGRKEASSEMLAAACGSLGLSLADFATRCAGLLGSAAGRPGGPTLMAA